MTATTTRTASTIPAKPSIDWARINAMVRDKKLSRTDADVLRVILRFRTRFGDSAWCPKRVVAKELGVDEKTVQRSFESLEKRGVIRQSQVSAPGHPDPDEPRNKTGWRIYFLWITTRSNFGAAPDRRPPGERTKMSSPPKTVLSYPERTEMSSPQPCATIEPPRGELRTEKKEIGNDDDGIASAKQAAEIDACTSSSYFIDPLSTPIRTSPRPLPKFPLTSAMPPGTPQAARPDPMAASEPAIDLALLTAALVARAAALLDVPAAAAAAELEGYSREFGAMARAKGLRFDESWLSAALDAADAYNRKPGNLPVKSFRFLAKPLLSFLARGGPPPQARPPAAPPPTYHRARAIPPPDQERVPPGGWAAWRASLDLGTESSP